jgi:hypothetical protein
VKKNVVVLVNNIIEIDPLPIRRLYVSFFVLECYLSYIIELPKTDTMDKTIKLRVKKEIDRSNELKVLKLKGSLITKGYTEIIHIADENEDFYLNSFSTSVEHKKEAEDFVIDYISANNLTDTIILL